MIVCDNVPARERTASILYAHGCPTVIEAADPDYAFELLVTRPEIRATVISAEQRSILDGFDFARVVVEHWPEVKHVIVIGSDPVNEESASLDRSAVSMKRCCGMPMVLRLSRAKWNRLKPTFAGRGVQAWAADLAP